MYEPDYQDNMMFYQDQLAKKGITKEMFDMDSFVGLTAMELQNIVDNVQLKKSHTTDTLVAD
ncbi:MAG: hypothetical protein K1W38_11385 [Lachnospiraceae bacterium]